MTPASALCVSVLVSMLDTRQANSQRGDTTSSPHPPASPWCPWHSKSSPRRDAAVKPSFTTDKISSSPPQTRSSTLVTKSSEQRDAVNGVFTRGTTSSSHRTTESPTVVAATKETFTMTESPIVVAATNEAFTTTESPTVVAAMNEAFTTIESPTVVATMNEAFTMTESPTVVATMNEAFTMTESPTVFAAMNKAFIVKKSFITGTTLSSHRPTESPTAVPRAEPSKNSIVLDTAAITQCELENAVKEFRIDSDPLSFRAANVIIDVQNFTRTVSSNESNFRKCTVLVKAPAGRSMSVRVANINCDRNHNDVMSMYWIREQDGGSFQPPWIVMRGTEAYCEQSLEAVTLYAPPGTAAEFNLEFSFFPVESLHVFLNFTILPESFSIMTVEYTTRLNGSVSTPGWDGVTSFHLVMDTKVSVAVPAGHEVMVSVLQMDLHSIWDAHRRSCSDTAFLALYDHPDADPLRVYCENVVPAPVALTSSSGHITLLLRVFSTELSKGFKLQFSFFPPSARLVQLSDGTWNCSVAHWRTEFQHLFPCNYQSECAGGEDEAVCPYSTAHCGAGRVDIAGFCYVLINARRNESESPFALPGMSWNMAEERCSREGGHLASLNTYREKKAVLKFKLNVDLDQIFFVGLVPTGSSLPLL